MAKTKMVKIQKDNGNIIEVTEKAFKVVYSEMGYKLAKGKKENQNSQEKDISEMSSEELQKVKNDDLKAYLDHLGIEYPSDAKKEDLIALIVLDDEGEENGN